jgi:hypothetical protein
MLGKNWFNLVKYDTALSLCLENKAEGEKYDVR